MGKGLEGPKAHDKVAPALKEPSRRAGTPAACSVHTAVYSTFSTACRRGFAELSHGGPGGAVLVGCTRATKEMDQPCLLHLHVISLIASFDSTGPRRRARPRRKRIFKGSVG